MRDAEQAVSKVLSALPPQRRRVQLEVLLTASVKVYTEAADKEDVAEDKTVRFMLWAAQRRRTIRQEWWPPNASGGTC